MSGVRDASSSVSRDDGGRVRPPTSLYTRTSLMISPTEIPHVSNRTAPCGWRRISRVAGRRAEVPSISRDVGIAIATGRVVIFTSRRDFLAVYIGDIPLTADAMDASRTGGALRGAHHTRRENARRDDRCAHFFSRGTRRRFSSHRRSISSDESRIVFGTETDDARAARGGLGEGNLRRCPRRHPRGARGSRRAPSHFRARRVHPPARLFAPRTHPRDPPTRAFVRPTGR